MSDEHLQSDIRSMKSFWTIVNESVDARWKENDARRKASQPEPDNPLMCDLLSIMNHLIKAVGKLGAETRKNERETSL